MGASTIGYPTTVGSVSFMCQKLFHTKQTKLNNSKKKCLKEIIFNKSWSTRSVWFHRNTNFFFFDYFHNWQYVMPGCYLSTFFFSLPKFSNIFMKIKALRSRFFFLFFLGSSQPFSCHQLQFEIPLVPKTFAMPHLNCFFFRSIIVTGCRPNAGAVRQQKRT